MAADSSATVVKLIRKEDFQPVAQSGSGRPFVDEASYPALAAEGRRPFSMVRGEGWDDICLIYA